MELTLNIYEGKKVVKQYTADSIDLSFGVIEDVLDAFDFESMTSGSNAEIAKAIIKCKDQLKPFLMDIFDGVTADEIRKARTNNLIEIFRRLYQYAVGELNGLGAAKN